MTTKNATTRTNLTSMPVYLIDPLLDPRWNELLAWHPDASVFHTPAWLRSLGETYGYKSFALTTTGPSQPLQNGVVFTHVKSWLTGSRLISVPFADHCQPLVDRPGSLAQMVESLGSQPRRSSCRFLEIRPNRPLGSVLGSQWSSSESFAWHTLDLRTSPGDLLARFDKTSVRQPIFRAQREKLEVLTENPRDLLKPFFGLLVSTRRRHGVPPQPLPWFEALIRNFGDALQIRVALKDGTPVAAILTLRFRETLVYKYSCSDNHWKRLGGTPCLLWSAIQEARANGATTLDLGRTEMANAGLIAFKDHWGTTRHEICYYRTATKERELLSHSRTAGMFRKLLSAMPDRCLIAAGRILYRHVG